MKVALWIAGGLVAALAAAYVGMRLLLSADVDTSTYATLSEARADQLFERGWLPDILPASARDIRTTNDLDLNTSAGGFHLEPSDYYQFTARLRPYSSMASPFADLDGYVRRMREDGSQAGVFSDPESTWLFVCEEGGGYCEYTMWVHRQ